MSGYDLIVMGAGPAGAAAAITAARAGFSVLLLEKGSFPRHKVCGEFVSAESLRLLQSLLANSFETRFALQSARPITQARAFLDGRMVEFKIDPPAASLSRFDLDFALWKAVQAAGVECRAEITVLSVSGKGPYTVQATGEQLTSTAVINATGRWSNLTADRSLLDTSEKWLGVKAHFFEENAPASTDLYFLEDGYCGVQPVSFEGDGGRKRINACAMVKAGKATSMQEVLELREGLRERSRSWQIAMDPVSTSPLVFRTPDPERNGILMAGDAAGFVDPFIGDGISLALRSGEMAAQSLAAFLQDKCSLVDAAWSYRVSYESRLRPVFRASATVRKLLTLPSVIRGPLAGMVGVVPGMAEMMVRATR